MNNEDSEEGNLVQYFFPFGLMTFIFPSLEFGGFFGIGFIVLLVWGFFDWKASTTRKITNSKR